MRHLFTAFAMLLSTCLLAQTSDCEPPTAAAFIENGGATDSILVCIGTEVTFDASASVAADGFDIAAYHWSFGNGAVDSTSGAIVNHTFNEEGPHYVQLNVTDSHPSNPCSAALADPLRVYVSFGPTYNGFPSDTTICVGQALDLTGIGGDGAYDGEWNATGMQAIDGGCITDALLGVEQVFPIIFDEFNLGDTITSTDDFGSICVNMEHSYMGDLVIQLTCPNGSSAMLQQQIGGGTQLGIPVQTDNVDCNDNTTMGEGWTYCWNSTATESWWDWTIENQGTLPEGTYAPAYPLSDLIGCPLQGVWELGITDNWAADDGVLFEMGMAFAPSFYSDYIPFITTIGEDADSSHWDLSGEYIIANSDDLNQITIQPDAAGIYEYDYWVVNNHGCEFDSTVTVEVIAGPEISVGPDVLYDCSSPVLLEGVIEGLPPVECGDDSGIFTYCFGNDENMTITYCPDNPDDGVTAMTMEFLSGELELFADYVIILNGDSANSPWMTTEYVDDLTGLSYTANNPTGCITWTFVSGTSVSCADGDMEPIVVSVSCGFIEQDVNWSWEPPLGLSTPNSQSTAAAPEQSTVYTLTSYPNGYPACAQSDSLEVSILPFEATIEGFEGPSEYCEGDEVTYGVASLPGAEFYEWTLPDGWTGMSTTENIAATAGPSGTIGVRASDGCGFTEPYQTDVEGLLPPLPAETIEGETLVCNDANESHTYTVDTSADEYHWTVTGADIDVLTTTENFIEIVWEELGVQSIGVVAANSCGETELITVGVTVDICTGIGDVYAEQLIRFWPNPSNGKVSLDGDLLNEGPVSLRLYNLLGEEVMSAPISRDRQFDMSALPSGLYLMQFYMYDELLQVSRVVKN